MADITTTDIRDREHVASGISSWLKGLLSKRPGHKRPLSKGEVAMMASALNLSSKETRALVSRVYLLRVILGSARGVLESLRDLAEPGSVESQDAARILGLIHDCERMEDKNDDLFLRSAGEAARILRGGPGGGGVRRMSRALEGGPAPGLPGSVTEISDWVNGRKP